jgi:hypothetical protein
MVVLTSDDGDLIGGCDDGGCVVGSNGNDGRQSMVV